MTSPSGEQWTLRHGEDELVVVEVGGGVRRWDRAGVAVLAGYDQDEMCQSGRGQQLIPWPNRIRDGLWTFDGMRRQLPLTEVAHGNASHGLLRWAPWRLVERGVDFLTVGVRLFPIPGWDWVLDCTTRYAVSPAGLHVTHAVTNLSTTPAPFGLGTHPYLAIGDTPVEQVEVTVPADTWIEVDERLLPVARREVSGTAFDFRAPRPIGDRRLDTAFTDLIAEEDGRWRVRVAAPGRAPWVLWARATDFPWTQVFSGKAEAGRSGEHGIAVEPMTCPADAFNSGDDLLLVAPGQTWRGTWGISPG